MASAPRKLLRDVAVDDFEVIRPCVGVSAQIAGTPVRRDAADKAFFVLGFGECENLGEVQCIAIGLGAIL